MIHGVGKRERESKVAGKDSKIKTGRRERRGERVETESGVEEAQVEGNVGEWRRR